MSIGTRKKDAFKSGEDGAQVKLRWLELDVQGGTTELIEGFKSFAIALRDTGRAVPATRSLTEPKTNGGSATTTVIDTQPIEQEDSSESTNLEVTDDLSGARVELDSPKRRPAPKAPKFLSDLDLTKASTQLNEFVAEKKPDGDMDRYAVIGFWFKHQLGIEEITIDHVFTAYKSLGWQAQLPDNPSQTFRNLKSNKNWFDGGAKRGSYKINWNGENAVNKMGAAK